MPVASAQVKSAVLIAGLQGEGRTTVIENVRTRDHTERMLEAMGVDVRTERPNESAQTVVTVPGGSEPRAVEVNVPGDISSAMFFVCAAAVLPGSEVRLPGTGVNPTRTGALRVLQEMGADIRFEDRMSSAGEEMAELVVRGGGLIGIEIDGGLVPTLIDELPVLAVIATQAEGTTVVRGARELRYKESDRIRAIVSNLLKLGARVEEFEDGFAVEGPCALHGGVVSSCGDHRIAMAMAVAGLIAEGGVKIRGSSATQISYPGFFDDLGRLTN
jgi:3-phosphoshikimate 1-carboxyvinyltransferase